MKNIKNSADLDFNADDLKTFFDFKEIKLEEKTIDNSNKLKDLPEVLDIKG